MGLTHIKVRRAGKLCQPPNGRRPTGVKDLLAEADGLLLTTTSQREGDAVPWAGGHIVSVHRGPSSVPEGLQPSI